MFDRADPESDFLDTALLGHWDRSWRGLDLRLSLPQHPRSALGEPACLPLSRSVFQVWAVGDWDPDPRCCCCSVAQLWPTLCAPMDCSMPGFPVLQSLLASAQTHVHWVDGVIQPSNPLFTWPLLFVYLYLVLSCLSTCPQGISIFISEMNHWATCTWKISDLKRKEIKWLWRCDSQAVGELVFPFLCSFFFVCYMPWFQSLSSFIQQVLTKPLLFPVTWGYIFKPLWAWGDFELLDFKSFPYVVQQIWWVCLFQSLNGQSGRLLKIRSVTVTFMG